MEIGLCDNKFTHRLNLISFERGEWRGHHSSFLFVTSCELLEDFWVMVEHTVVTLWSFRSFLLIGESRRCFYFYLKGLNKWQLALYIKIDKKQQPDLELEGNVMIYCIFFYFFNFYFATSSSVLIEHPPWPVRRAQCSGSSSSLLSCRECPVGRMGYDEPKIGIAGKRLFQRGGRTPPQVQGCRPSPQDVLCPRLRGHAHV